MVNKLQLILEEVVANVTKNKHNNITTTYYLLLKKKIRNGEKSNVDSFLKSRKDTQLPNTCYFSFFDYDKEKAIQFNIEQVKNAIKNPTYVTKSPEIKSPNSKNIYQKSFSERKNLVNPVNRALFLPPKFKLSNEYNMVNKTTFNKFISKEENPKPSISMTENPNESIKQSNNKKDNYIDSLNNNEINNTSLNANDSEKFIQKQPVNPDLTNRLVKNFLQSKIKGNLKKQTNKYDKYLKTPNLKIESQTISKKDSTTSTKRKKKFLNTSLIKVIEEDYEDKKTTSTPPVSKEVREFGVINNHTYHSKERISNQKLSVANNNTENIINIFKINVEGQEKKHNFKNLNILSIINKSSNNELIKSESKLSFNFRSKNVR
jgi:hypothetical protein